MSPSIRENSTEGRYAFSDAYLRLNYHVVEPQVGPIPFLFYCEGIARLLEACGLLR